MKLREKYKEYICFSFALNSVILLIIGIMTMNIAYVNQQYSSKLTFLCISGSIVTGASTMLLLPEDKMNRLNKISFVLASISTLSFLGIVGLSMALLIFITALS